MHEYFLIMNDHLGSVHVYMMSPISLLGHVTLTRCVPSYTVFALCLSWWLIIKSALRKKALFTKMRCFFHDAKIALG